MMTLTRTLFVSSLLLAGLAATAMPPKIEPTKVKQPDGSELTIKVTGCRSLHFVTTEDGTIVNRDTDGYFRLAEITASGNVRSTDIRATGNNLSRGTKLTGEVILSILTSSTEPKSKAPQSGLGRYNTSYPTIGSPKVPVILVEFQDVKFSDSYNVKEYFSELFAGDDLGQPDGRRSIKKYFADQSHGNFTPQFDLYGPVTLPEKMAYYGDNSGVTDHFSHYMVSHSLKILDPVADFSQYDENDDGDIDFVYVIYAGYGENRGAGEETVWPHAGYLKGDADFCMVDGVWANDYACSNELIFGKDEPEGISAFVHEYSHIIGLPDLYPSDPAVFGRDGWDYTAGQYSVLDYGTYNDDGHTPPNYTAFERNALGWDEPMVIDRPCRVELRDISTGQFGLIATDSPSEFYLFENRQLEGWDAAIPNHGLLIWHVDYVPALFSNNNVNNNMTHQHVELIKANNHIFFGHPLEAQTGFPFPGTDNVTEFTAQTVPAFLPWGGEDLGMPVTEIREEHGIVKFNVASEGDSDVLVTGLEKYKSDDGEVFTVYSTCGILLGTGDFSFLSSLPAGLYIVNGRKLRLH